MIGRTLGSYVVLAKLGEGGMGEVYRATDTTLGRTVAVKVLAPRLANDRDRLARFQREARAVAALNHPNIVTLFSVEEVEGIHFLTMEYVEGRSLAEVIPPGGVPIDGLLAMGATLADALAAAHDKGIIHRDLKPANIMMTTEGRLKVLDFGLVKEIRAASPSDPTVAHAPQTELGVVVGTPAYMSPEQISGRSVDQRTDLFSLGIVLYEMATGHRPFRGATSFELAGAILHAAPGRADLVRPEVPADLATLIERCLEKDPARRVQSAREVARGLGEIADRSTEGRSIAPPRQQPEIRYCTTADGLSIAYAVVGSGPVIVRVLGHFSHLEMEWQWPDLRRFWEHLAEHCTVVRYDGRGVGLSDRFDGDFTEETRQLDLAAVLDAVGAEKTVLLGVSEGGWTAAQYAIQHEQAISHIVLYGAYSRGAQARPGYDADEDRALITLIRKGWGRDTPAFRQIITSQFFRPDADPTLIAHFNELQRVSTNGQTAARYQESLHRRGDGREMFRQLRIPTLVVQCREDLAVDPEEARILASIIPGAQLVMLPGGTHYFPTDPAVVTKVATAILQFLQRPVRRRELGPT